MRNSTQSFRSIRSALRVPFGTALVAAALVACAPKVTSTPYVTLAPKTSAGDVQVFSDGRPDRPYQEVGLIEVKKLVNLSGSYGDLILSARQEAARMGADAIIVTRDATESTTTVGSVTKRKNGKGADVVSTTSTNKPPHISVVAIAWK